MSTNNFAKDLADKSWAEHMSEQSLKKADAIANSNNDNPLYSLETIEKAFFNYDRPPIGNYRIDNHLKKKREEWIDFLKTLEDFHLFS